MLNYTLVEDTGNLCITFPYGRYLTVQAGGYGSRADRPLQLGIIRYACAALTVRPLLVTRVDEREAGAVIYTV